MAIFWLAVVLVLTIIICFGLLDEEQERRHKELLAALAAKE